LTFGKLTTYSSIFLPPYFQGYEAWYNLGLIDMEERRAEEPKEK
jgi:hypothetical protein